MVGPSSSHTAGAVRLANLARLVASKPIRKVEFLLYNSFAKTYRGHGTDRGLLAGILGYGVEDERIREAYELAKQAKLDYALTPVDQPNHYTPNTVIIKLVLEDGEEMTITGHSVGGGKVYLSKINDFHVSLKGELPTLILYYKDKPGMIWQVTKVLAEHDVNIATLTCTRQQRGGGAFMTITLDSLPGPGDIAAITQIPDIYFARCIDQLPSFAEV